MRYVVSLLLGLLLVIGDAIVVLAEPKEDLLYTSDNETISYCHYKNGFDSVIVVCPGFFNSKKNKWMLKTVEMLSSKHDVIIFDFRGHGESSGRFSWLAREHGDVDTVLDYVDGQGYENIGLLGFSLGAAASINAASQRDNVRSMVLISCPSTFKGINFHFWEWGIWSNLQDNIECDWGEKGARTTHIFLHKPKPIEEIAFIRDTAILFIHGDSDWIIKDYHSQKLYNAANTRKKIEIVKNGLHAERLIQQYPVEIQHLMLGWLADTMQ